MEGSAHSSLPALPIPGIGLLERPRIYDDDGIQRLVVSGDAIEVLLNQLMRRDVLLLQRLLHPGNRGLDDRKGGGFSRHGGQGK